jgi:hypothetical protein
VRVLILFMPRMVVFCPPVFDKEEARNDLILTKAHRLRNLDICSWPLCAYSRYDGRSRGEDKWIVPAGTQKLFGTNDRRDLGNKAGPALEGYVAPLPGNGDNETILDAD